MGLSILYQGGPRAGEVLTFDDDVTMVTIGRDASKCNVVFDADETQVGREHCALRRVLGRYRLVLNAQNAVFVNGKPARDDDEITREVDLQLGPKGPVLVVEPQGAGSLPGTEHHGARAPGQRTLLSMVGRSARANRALLVVVILLAIVGAGLAVQRFGGLQDEIQVTREEVTEISAEQQRLLAAATAGGHEETFADIAARVRESVYVLIAQTADGREMGLGTAWAVGDGVLATNAHVVAVVNEQRDAGATVVARAAGPPEGRAADLVVTSTRPHPGFQVFEEIWDEYQPMQMGEPMMSTGACDVGTVAVEGMKDVPALKIATGETLESLRAGQPVAYVGHPMENLTGGTLRTPEPKVQIGAITAVTDFFFAKTSPEDTQLVQHNLPLAGGASGSPMLNADGEVIALVSAGNFAVVEAAGADGPQLRRVGTGAQINFAQRADLLLELVGDEADAAHSARMPVWRTRLAQFESARITPANVVERVLADWSRTIAPDVPLRLSETSGTVRAVRGLSMPGYAAMATHRVKLDEPGAYLFLAVAAGGEDIGLVLLDRTETYILGQDTGPDFYPLAGGMFRAGGLNVSVFGTEPGVAYDLYVYRAVSR